MAVLPAKIFRSVSLAARFAIGIALLGLVGSVFSASRFAMDARRYRAALWPAVLFFGSGTSSVGAGCSTRWSRKWSWRPSRALHRRFLFPWRRIDQFSQGVHRIPEVAEVGPLPRTTATFSFSGSLTTVFLTPPQRACYQFVAMTLPRSEQHLQVLMGFMAVGVVVAANVLMSAPGGWASVVSGGAPSVAFLSVPLILSYCMVTGIRFAFEMPADLRANWIFILLLEHRWKEARRVSRRVLLVFCLSWLAPAIFLTSLFFFGWRTALLHSLILVICTIGLIELSLFKFRKIPFTCSHPPFQSHSGLIAIFYFFGFVAFTTYTAQMEYWAMLSPWRVILFVPLFLAVILGLHAHRKQMLDMDKELIFEDAPSTRF